MFEIIKIIIISIITAYATCKFLDKIGEKLILRGYKEMTIVVEDVVTCGFVESLNGRTYSIKKIERVVKTYGDDKLRVTGLMKEL